MRVLSASDGRSISQVAFMTDIFMLWSSGKYEINQLC
jgi:hypothetical protein